MIRFVLCTQFFILIYWHWNNNDWKSYNAVSIIYIIKSYIKKSARKWIMKVAWMSSSIRILGNQSGLWAIFWIHLMFDSEQNKERNIKLSIDNLFTSPLWCFTAVNRQCCCVYCLLVWFFNNWCDWKLILKLIEHIKVKWRVSIIKYKYLLMD